MQTTLDSHKNDLCTIASQEKMKEKLASALLSSISHDFKTPLTSIIGSLSAVRHMRGVLNEETRNKLIEAAQEEAERLNALITNLLNITKLESDTVQLNYQWQNPEELMARIIRRMQFGLTQHRVEYRTIGVPCLFYMDVMLMEQVVQNLLDNAVKYSPENSCITIVFECREERAHIRIKDQGCGIPLEHRTQIFEKFFRSHLLKKKAGGAGLGLAICRTIIEAHDGLIVAEENDEPLSPDYPGTSFHIILPEARAAVGAV